MGKASKDKRDIFYRLAKEQGWRARSAFKLLQADETFNLLNGIERAVDLCAAPGGWSQVLSKRMWEPRTVEERENVKIIAVDMQGMAPIDGVTQLRADITKESTSEAIIEFFEGKKAQIVVSDGAPDVTGLHDWDAYMQAQLLLSALSIATYILEEGGSFMGKVYRAANTSSVYLQLQRFFKDVCVFKPSASRNSSIEAFVVARQFKLPEGHVPCNLITEWYKKPEEALKNITGKKGDDVVCLPFVAHQCEYDADLSYPLDESYEHQEPVQKPLTAAYQEVIEKTKNISLKYDSYIVRHDQEIPTSYLLEQSGSSSAKQTIKLEQYGKSHDKQMTTTDQSRTSPISDLLEQSGSSSTKQITKLEQYGKSHDKQMPTTKQENTYHNENASNQSATSQDEKTPPSEQ